MEVTASNVDRLATIEARSTKRVRGIIGPLYDAARMKLGGKPVSLAAAECLREAVKPGDTVIVTYSFGGAPLLPFGETDGPLGVASVARAVRFGLQALPILVTSIREIEPLRQTARAAGLVVMEHDERWRTQSAAATSVVFPDADTEASKKIAASIFDKYKPRAVVAVELAGPNKKGQKHFGSGKAFKDLAALEHLFYEASSRGILTIGCLDQGNEVGGGTIEEAVRGVVSYGDVCQCECQGGLACAVKTDVAFPAAISNWAAYAIVGVLGLLLKKPEILQDAETERRMMEACVMAGALDGVTGNTLPSVDGVSLAAHQAYVMMLHTVIENALA